MALRFSPSRGAGAFSLSSYIRGPAGAAATISAGTQTALAEGSTPTVTNSGTSSAAVFNFGIPRGVIPAIGFNFSTTTTDSDPGGGNVRFNNATVASVTTIYFDNVDRDGNTVTGWLDSFDDSTSTGRGTLVITPPASPTAKLIYAVTGSVVDGTGYRKVTVSWVSGTVLPTNAAQLAFAFSRTGDQGTGIFPGASVDSEIVLFSGTGGSTVKRATNTGMLRATSGVIATASLGTDYGDVVGVASSVDSEIALFNSTTGKVIKRASLTGIVKAASGVASAATAGTDYVKPDTTSNFTAGFTATSFSAGTKSSGTFTPDPASGNHQHYTNGGAHTLAPPTSVCTMILECTNATAGALTTSGFTIVDGDTYSSTGTKKHIFYITKTNSFSHLNVRYVTGT